MPKAATERSALIWEIETFAAIAKKRPQRPFRMQTWLGVPGEGPVARMQIIHCRLRECSYLLRLRGWGSSMTCSSRPRRRLPAIPSSKWTWPSWSPSFGPWKPPRPTSTAFILNSEPVPVEVQSTLMHPRQRRQVRLWVPRVGR